VWLGRVVSEDAWLSTFASSEAIGEFQRWDKTNYQIGYEIGEFFFLRAKCPFYSRDRLIYTAQKIKGTLK
jgi:hypothetical protein